MFPVRQLYLEQIYGVVVAATLAACALPVTEPRLIKDSDVALDCGLLIYVTQQDVRVGSALAAASQEGGARLLGPLYC